MTEPMAPLLSMPTMAALHHAIEDILQTPHRFQPAQLQERLTALQAPLSLVSTWHAGEELGHLSVLTAHTHGPAPASWARNDRSSPLRFWTLLGVDPNVPDGAGRMATVQGWDTSLMDHRDVRWVVAQGADVLAVEHTGAPPVSRSLLSMEFGEETGAHGLDEFWVTVQQSVDEAMNRTRQHDPHEAARRWERLMQAPVNPVHAPWSASWRAALLDQSLASPVVAGHQRQRF